MSDINTLNTVDLYMCLFLSFQICITIFCVFQLTMPIFLVFKMSLDKNELSMAKMLVDNMTKPFVLEDFQDEYQARLRNTIMKKIQGKEIVTADTSEPSNVIDLMEALLKSLEISIGNGRKKTGTA